MTSRMTRMTGPDCAVMCNLINIHTYTYINTSTYGTKYQGVEKDISVHGFCADAAING